MGLFSDLTNIYDNDLKNIHGNEVYNFINRNKDKIEELDKNIIRDFIVKINYINSLKTKNYQKSYQISKIKKEIIQKDQRIAELEEENKKLKERQCCGMEFCDLDLQNNIEIGLLQNKVKKLEKEAEDKNIWRKEDGRRTSR